MTREKSCNQIRIISKITAAACLLSMALSYKLWIATGNFPLTPAADFLPVLPSLLNYIIAGAIGLLLLSIIIIRNPQKIIILVTILAIFYSAYDINRIQPWFYQYICMFFILSFFDFRCDDVKKQNSIILIFRFMIAGIYFWSGVQKLNPNFISDTFPWLLEPFQVSSPEKYILLGKALPLIESISAVLLIINDTKKAACILIILMHLFILFIIGPLGHNYNPVVWPWNITMIFLVLMLFYNEKNISIDDIRTMFRYNFIKFIFLIFCIAPQLNLFNLWDSYLSHNLYSGNTSKGIIEMSESAKNSLPQAIQKNVFPTGENKFSLDIKYWCMQEKGVPAYPEKRNFEAVTQKIIALSNNQQDVYLSFKEKLSIKNLSGK